MFGQPVHSSRLPRNTEPSFLCRTLLAIHSESSRVYIFALENELMVAGARMGGGDGEGVWNRHGHLENLF